MQGLRLQWSGGYADRDSTHPCQTGFRGVMNKELPTPIQGVVRSVPKNLFTVGGNTLCWTEPPRHRAPSRSTQPYHGKGICYGGLIHSPSINSRRLTRQIPKQVFWVLKISQSRIAEITGPKTSVKTKSPSPAISDIRERLQGLGSKQKRLSGATKRRYLFLVKQGYSIE